MSWTLNGTHAEWNKGSWNLNWKGNKASDGLEISYASHLQSSHLAYQERVFLVNVAPKLHEPTDGYFRKNDLTILYAEESTRNFSTQLDFRLLEVSESSLVLDAWISVQTHLLDSHPALTLDFPGSIGSDILLAQHPNKPPHAIGVVDDLPSKGDLIGQSESVLAIMGRRESKERQMHTLLMLHPMDQGDASWSRGTKGDPKATFVDGCRVGLFGDFMEKGVIRRARLRLIVSLPPLDQSELQNAIEEFASSPLPLDT